MRGWIYRDIIVSLLAIFGEGMIILWHYSFTPDNIWWGGDYIVTYFHSWKYLVRGVIISWHYNIISDTTLESGTGGDYIWIFSLCKFDFAVIPGFYYSYPYIHPMKLGVVEVIISKHDTLFAVETQCFGGYVNGLYQQSVINKNL